MSKFIVTKEIEFDAGHRVPKHTSKCRNPHGHRYKVVAHVEGELHEEGSATGMVMDFGDIKAALTNLVHDIYDHGFIVYKDDVPMLKALGCWIDSDGNMQNGSGWKIIVVDWTPTAEEMARAIYNDMKLWVSGLKTIEVYETPTSRAIYPGSV